MSWVYFVRLGDWLKIGYSQTPRRRAESIVASALRRKPERSTLAPRVVIGGFRGGIGDERKIHQHLSGEEHIGEFYRWSAQVERYVSTLNLIPLPFQCHECRAVFTSEEENRKHVRKACRESRQAETKYLCDDCGLYFLGLKTLRRHIQACRKESAKQRAARRKRYRSLQKRIAAAREKLSGMRAQLRKFNTP